MKLLVLADPNTDWLPGMLDALGDSVAATVVTSEAEVAAKASEADAVLAAGFVPAMMQAAVVHGGKDGSSVRWFHSLWTGVEKLLTPEMIASPIPLTNGRGAFARSLGEWTVGAMIYFSYDFRRMIRQQQEGVYQGFNTEEVHGKTLGIIGYGEIGKAAAERAKPLGVRILALRRHPERFQGDTIVDQAFGLEQIQDLIAASDYVMCAAPLTDQTRGMVGPAQIAAMKPSAVLINVGRGAVVDEGPLIEALETGKIKGAALDVFVKEPLPDGHPFYGLENVLLSPHTADRVADFVQPAVDCFLENLRRFQAGEELKFVVDKRAGY